MKRDEQQGRFLTTSEDVADEYQNDIGQQPYESCLIAIRKL